MGNVLSRSWSMDNAEFSSEINPSKTFNQPGTYRITLSVTSENSQNAVTKDLTVVNPATFHQGNYVVNGSSQAGSIYGGWVSSFSENGTFDAITISKFSLIKEPVNINLDYPFVTINEQHVYNANGAHYVVSGNGKFEGNDLKINYHILYYNSSIHVYGTDTYTKQN
jgi:PKD repeat protein